MPHTPNDTTESGEQMAYHIRIKGHLSSRWERWFEPMTITPQANGDTLLAGPVVDQAALHGVIGRIRDLGLPLLAVNCVVESRASTTGEARWSVGAQTRRERC